MTGCKFIINQRKINTYCTKLDMPCPMARQGLLTDEKKGCEWSERVNAYIEETRK